MVFLISTTLIFAAISGFESLSDGELFSGVAGQLGHELLSIVCIALVGLAFWRFG